MCDRDEDAPAQIPDEDAVKPDGWLDDEPEYIGDPEAVKPDDWWVPASWWSLIGWAEVTICLYLSIRDEDMDGEWEAIQIRNPACGTAPGCGTWKRPMIDNPNYKGKWKPPMIDNPNYQVPLWTLPYVDVQIQLRLGDHWVKPFPRDGPWTQHCSVLGRLEAEEDPQPGILWGPAAVQDDSIRRFGAWTLVHDLWHLLRQLLHHRRP